MLNPQQKELILSLLNQLTVKASDPNSLVTMQVVQSTIVALNEPDDIIATTKE